MMISPQWALLLGLIFSFILPKESLLQGLAKTWATRLLQISVVLLGASLNFNSVLKQGAEGALITFISIAVVFIVGILGQKALKIEKDQGLLIIMGTAICGGSAISALAPVIAADSLAITVSIAIVFILNALAVFFFPIIGEALSLGQVEFGTWSALAIHDTSSVVAASGMYGPEALKVATTIKLTRALWIIPVTLFFSFYLRKNKGQKIPKLPWFILWFLATSLTFTLVDGLSILVPHLTLASKTGLTLTLFLIGLTFDFGKMKQLGLRPLLFGVGLWIFVSVMSLISVKFGKGII